MKKIDLSALPEEFHPFARNVEKWIRKNPEKAVLYGAAVGAALGVVGIRRLREGVSLVTESPMLSALVSGAVMKVVSSEEQGSES